MSDPWEAETIEGIAREELEHRERVGEMLAELGTGPSRPREFAFLLTGLLVGMLCRIGALFGRLGWYAAMYGAGRLEASNVHEYVDAAEFAREAGLDVFVPDLMRMAYVEWQHEAFFFERCAEHPIGRKAPSWARPACPQPNPVVLLNE